MEAFMLPPKYMIECNYWLIISLIFYTPTLYYSNVSVFKVLLYFVFFSKNIYATSYSNRTQKIAT